MPLLQWLSMAGVVVLMPGDEETCIAIPLGVSRKNRLQSEIILELYLALSPTPYRGQHSLIEHLCMHFPA